MSLPVPLPECPPRAAPARAARSAAGFLLLAATLAGPSSLGAGADTNAPSPSPSPAPPPVASTAPWRPPPPPPDDFDWIQLKSGEWLKGRIKAIQDDTLDFDSEELEGQSFDWKDVHFVRSPRHQRLLFEDRTQVEGPVEITRDEIRVLNGSDPPKPRTRLQAMAPAGNREVQHWSGKVSAGLTFRAGNTSQAEFNASANLQRRTPSTRGRIDYLGYFSRQEEFVSANSHRVQGTFDLWLNRRLFLRTPFVEYFTDPFQNIAHRLTAGAGVGYDLIHHPRLEWNLTTGPAYQYSWFDSVPAGEAGEQGAAALAFGSRLEAELSKRIDFILEYSGQLTRREVGETAHHTVATLELDLTDQLDLDISFVWDRIAFPKPDGTGQTPNPDDFRLVIGLGLDF